VGDGESHTSLRDPNRIRKSKMLNEKQSIGELSPENPQDRRIWGKEVNVVETAKALGMILGAGIFLMWAGRYTHPWVCAAGGFALFIGVLGVTVSFLCWASTRELW